jgi:hypothetical protein
MNSHQRRKFRRKQKAPLLLKNNTTRFMREEWSWGEEINEEIKGLIFPNVSNNFLDNIDNCWTWDEKRNENFESDGLLNYQEQ